MTEQRRISKRASAQPNAGQRRRPDTVSALRRGIAVLRCFEPGVASLSNGAIARKTGIPKSTVARLVATLASLGYLEPIRETEEYRLGVGVIAPAQAFLANLDVRKHARPSMLELAETTGTSVYLAVRDRGDMVIIEVCRSRSTVLLFRLDVGSRVPILGSGLGLAYLGGLSAGERSRAIQEVRDAGGESPSFPAHRITETIRQTEERGDPYYLSLGMWHPDVNAIALPLRGPIDELMSLGCVGPAFAYAEDRLRGAVAPKLMETARTIAGAIGGRVPVKTRGAEPSGDQRSDEPRRSQGAAEPRDA